MKMYRRALHAGAVSLLGAALAVGGCSPIPEIGEATAEETYALGSAAAAKGDHLLAIEAMNRVLSQSPLNEVADDALLALAESHRAMRDFASAEAEYDRLPTDYPRSPLVPEASYRLGLAYYDQSLPPALDQTMTERAIAQFEWFLTEYPGSPSVPAATERIAELRSRLAEKAYESARLYITLKNGASARTYFEAVVRDYPDTPWAPRALLAHARSAAQDGLPDDARSAYERLVTLYPESEEAKAAALELSGP